jgi:nucleotide-binding universal stress UspA family protein
VFTVTKALCPIDFSPASEHALEAAVALVEALGAELYLLHVVEGIPEASAAERDATRVESARDAVRDRLGALVGARELGGQPHLLVSDGDAAEEVLRMEEIFGIDLIVIAPHSRPTIGKVLFGSVAIRIARSARANVLIVKQHLVEEAMSPESP